DRVVRAEALTLTPRDRERSHDRVEKAGFGRRRKPERPPAHGEPIHERVQPLPSYWPSPTLLYATDPPAAVAEYEFEPHPSRLCAPQQRPSLDRSRSTKGAPQCPKTHSIQLRAV